MTENNVLISHSITNSITISRDVMLNNIKEYFNKNWNWHDIIEKLDEIKNDDDLMNIHNLLMYDIISPITNDSNDYVMIYYGFYHYIKNKHDIAEKYYLMASEKNNTYAMYILGLFYFDEKNDEELMKKYFLMAINNGDVESMYELGIYYYDELFDYKLAEKYFLMAFDLRKGQPLIDKGCYKVARLLSLIYYEKYNNFNLAKKYFLIALEHYSIDKILDDTPSDSIWHLHKIITIEENGDLDAVRELVNYYWDDNAEERENFYLMAAEKGDCLAMHWLAGYYSKKDERKLMAKYCMMAINNGHEDAFKIFSKERHCFSDEDTKIIFTCMIKYNKYDGLKDDTLLEFFLHKFTKDELEMISNKSPKELEKSPHIIKLLNKSLNSNIDNISLHFEYSMEGKGFKEAKEDFINNITNMNE